MSLVVTVESQLSVLENSNHSVNPFTVSGKLPVMEMFYTVQGEGFFAGTPAWFIRLSGCDVGCVWCDVKESWEVLNGQYLSIQIIIDEALKHPSRIAVITGGEPCMYDLSQLIRSLSENGFRVHIETSGAYPLSGNPDWVCVSPKKFKKPLKEVLARAGELKVVVFNNSDFEWAETNAAFVMKNCMLYLQPEFEKSTKILPAIVDYVKQHPQWRISLQTHKFIGIP
jgi:7-carboxy-7-deazaguanine synthase